MRNNKIHIIAITGGSGSGKTFLCDKIIKKFNTKKILKIEVDSYYKDLIHLKMEKREKNNFDHPDAFEFDLLYTHLNKIRNLKQVDIPIYNYKTHTRKKKINSVDKRYDIILLEGIFSTYKKNIRDMLSLNIFIEISNEIRKKRRIERDSKKRNRTIESIESQYAKTVEPMYKQYVEPTKKYSDIVIKDISKNDKGYIKLLQTISTLIK